MSDRTLYLDCFSGLAGDMTLGALIDLGLDAETLEAALQTLPLPEWRLTVGHAVKMGIRGVDVHVVVGGHREGPDGIIPADGHGHDHSEHGHGHEHGEHGHTHYADIVRIIEGGELPAPVVARALQAFELIAQAEAKVHGQSVEAVHFHEVAAADSVVDIVGVAYGLWALGVDRLISAPPPISRGFVQCAHGRMPLPAPATAEILRGLPIVPCPVQKELVTPTGAAFVKAWAADVGDFPEMVVDAVGYGAGDLDLPDRPNLLRAVMGHTPAGGDERCVVVETNLDDLNPEIAGWLIDQLLTAGALDAWAVPLHMKKGRPGLMVGALAAPGQAGVVEALLLRESSAIGLRRYPVGRHKAPRRSTTVHTPFGPVSVKLAERDGQLLNVAPEHADCARVAAAAGVPLQQVYQHAIAAFLNGREA